VKRSKSFVGLSLKLSGKVDLGKVAGDRCYGFFCLRCRRLRAGKVTKRGFLKCNVCGFEPKW
jgi:hypothetical protein